MPVSRLKRPDLADRRELKKARPEEDAQDRAERKLGEMLAETVRPGNFELSHDGIIHHLPNGVSPNQSSHWQTIAKLPAERRWKRSRGVNQLGKLIEGIHFQDGTARETSVGIAA